MKTKSPVKLHARTSIVTDEMDFRMATPDMCLIDKIESDVIYAFEKQGFTGVSLIPHPNYFLKFTLMTDGIDPTFIADAANWLVEDMKRRACHLKGE